MCHKNISFRTIIYIIRYLHEKINTLYEISHIYLVEAIIRKRYKDEAEKAVQVVKATAKAAVKITVKEALNFSLNN